MILVPKDDGGGGDSCAVGDHDEDNNQDGDQSVPGDGDENNNSYDSMPDLIPPRYYYMEVSDEISQVDGVDSTESDEDYGEDDIGVYRRSKRPRLAAVQRIESDSEEEENAPAPVNTARGDDDIELETSTEEISDTEAEETVTDAVTSTGAQRIVKNGREHVKIPSTGPTYVFMKSHRSKPSTIFRHVNDLLSMYEVRYA